MAKTNIKTNTATKPGTNDSGDFRELNVGSLKFYKPNEMEKGQTLTGTFIESKVIGNYEKPSHLFTRTLENGEVENYAINSTGQLDFYMNQIAPGSLVRLTYDGQEKLAKGKYAGKPAHKFKVAVSNTAPKPVVALAASIVEGDDADSDANDGSDDFDDSSL